jgi:D-lactate dehydrogenase (cytochrome)
MPGRAPIPYGIRTSCTRRHARSLLFGRNAPRRLISDGRSSHTRGSRSGLGNFFVPLAAVSSSVCVATYCLTRIIISAESPNHGDNSTSTLSLADMIPARYNLTDENIEAARDELSRLLTPERVITDIGALIAHSSTEWSPAPGGDSVRPHLIVTPESTEEVSAIAKICHRRRIPMIAFSGGTSLEGTLAATHGGVCIDFVRMKRIIAIHGQDMDVVVQPGVGYAELNEKLAEQNFFFPPDPGPGAQIGGMVSQGCSGTNAYRYGTMKDWVLGLTIVLADGTTIKTRHRPRKSSAGYNLTQLMVGSEGTLGIVTEASLKITKKPENVKVAIAAFPTTHKAVEVAVRIVQNDMPVAAMELLDDVTMRAVNQSGYCNRDYPQVPTLFLKFAGTSNSVQDQIKKVKEFSRDASCASFEVASDEMEAESLWQARKTALWSLMTLKNDPNDKFLSTDVAVPMSRLADIVEETHKRLQASGLIGSCLGHVGDGMFPFSSSLSG